MLYCAQSTLRPEKVIIENCPDRTIICLTDNVVELDNEEQVTYEYDEVRFDLPDDRSETVESVTEHFNEWWLYGQEDHTEPTLEERVALIEDILMEM